MGGPLHARHEGQQLLPLTVARRTLAWKEWGRPDGVPVLRLQGTPGSRLSRYARLEVWDHLGIRVIMADRPGYGASTRLPGRGIIAVADDLVELLDHLGLDAVAVVGGSGGGPHVLALSARHPERVRSATVVVGGAPLEDEDVPNLVGLNAEAYRLVTSGGWDALYPLVAAQRDAILKDPLAGIRGAMAGAPDADRVVMDDPRWQHALVEGVREALRPGAEGWADEAVAFFDWDFDVAEVAVPVVWWHGRNDANAPLPAVERLIRRMPSVELRLWDAAGHLETFHREPEILADLLAR